MTKCALYSILFLIAFSTRLTAAQSAQARLVCLSLRFHPANTTVLGQRYTLELGTAEGQEGLNGELTPTFDPTLPSHGTSFRFTDPILGEPMIGDLAVDVPTGTDNNANGFPDFFEVSQEVPSTPSFGLYAGPIDAGEVLATWSRAADSSAGFCRLQLVSETFGELPEFTAQFDLIEYNGALEYVPGAANVSGTVQLIQTGNPSNTLAGPARFTRAATNRFDEVTLASGVWSNHTAQTFAFTNSTVLRDTTLRTNYYALIDFEDGDLTTSAADYLTWQISLDDANDLDGDGVPDFTDDPAGQNLDRPELSVSVANNLAQLQIRGEVGKSYEVEETTALQDIQWTGVLAVTLTAPTQIVDLPVAGKSTIFWRLKER